MQDFAAQIKRCEANERAKLFGADDPEVERLAEETKRHERSGWMIRRRLNAAGAPKTPEPALKPTTLSAPRERRNRRASSPSRAGPDDDSESSEPAERRFCQNKRCEADISHLPQKAYHCDNGGACKQAAYRDRLTTQHLDNLVGTISDEVSCHCDPTGHLVIGGVCFTCGKPRGVVTRAWLTDDGPHPKVAAADEKHSDEDWTRLITQEAA